MWTTTFKAYVPHTLGLDETFNRLESLAGTGTNYPPYNVINEDNSTTILEVALAGFSEKELEVSTERNVLTLKGRKEPVEKQKNYQHKGISTRSFEKNWQLGEDVEVDKVSFKDGMLTIVLKKQLPEKMKKKIWF